jgi:hypothetical protein
MASAELWAILMRKKEFFMSVEKIDPRNINAFDPGVLEFLQFAYEQDIISKEEVRKLLIEGCNKRN